MWLYWNHTKFSLSTQSSCEVELQDTGHLSSSIFWAEVSTKLERADIRETIRGDVKLYGSWNSYIMVNFMHQFDWAEECPDSWLHISVSVRVFPDEISTWMGRLSEKLTSSVSVGMIHSIKGLKRTKNVEEGQISSLPDLGHSSFPALIH